MTIKPYIRIVFLVSFVAFVANKVYVRPWVLEHLAFGPAIVIVHSLPNLIEAVLGTTLLTGIVLSIRERTRNKFGGVSDASLYLIVSSVAGVYVVTQEIKWHNLGGNNVYDPYDLVASLIGLIVINRVITHFGFLK